MPNAAVVIPTLNGGQRFIKLMDSIQKQVFCPQHVIVIDSSSTDGTVDVASRYRCKVLVINREDFNHGATRQMAVELSKDADILVYLTQDAVLADENALSNLLLCFKNTEVGAAYGRQLPHVNSGPIGAFARIFNYPSASRLKSLSDSEELGIKTAFISNSFAAYRRDALMAVGGFPANTILSEDTYVAAKMLLAGWKVQYCAEAKVYHSHDYDFISEFRRYFDIGVFHAREKWIRESFGRAEGEGLRYVMAEARYLWRNGYAYLLPSALLRTILKYAGYRLGMMEHLLPLAWKKHLSMNKGYWCK